MVVRATNRYKKETNEYYARTPIILIIPFSRRLQFYVLLVDLGQEPAPASVMPQCQEGPLWEGSWGFLLMVPEEMVLVLADLDRASTVLHHHQQTSTTSTSRNQHWGSSHLRNQNAVAGLHRNLHPLALFIESTWAHGEDLGLRQLLDGRLGEEDSRGSLDIGLDTLDEDAVEEGREGLDGAEGSGL